MIQVVRITCAAILTICHGLAVSQSSKYIFFLHNRFVQLNDLNTVHPEYGKAEYLEIVKIFRDSGFIVISGKRARDTEARTYARNVVKQIDSLLKRGVKPGDITVIGTSMGGYIAQYASTYLKNPNVNFVFVGCYQERDLRDEPEINWCGNILSIYAKDDTLGVSAIKRVEGSKLKITRFKEIELHTHRKHGFLYHPMKEWMLPTIQWASGNYGILTVSEIKAGIDSILATKPAKPFSGVILIKEGTNIIYSRVQGSADLSENKPLTMESQFIIGSISKQFTAVLVLLEMEKGHLKLNDPIRKYLPDLQQTWTDSVTIYHLLTHSHGITSLNGPLNYRPGSRMDYGRGNNIGYGLLARILERTSGRSFAELADELFKRYGMKNTFHPDIKKYDRLAKGYTEDEAGKVVLDSLSFQAAPAAGGFVSTAADLIIWNEQLHGGKILKPETYKSMTAIQPGIIRQHPLWGPTEYGLGITIRGKENNLQLGQTGFAPGFASMDFYFPQSKISAVILQNVVYGPQSNLQKAFYFHLKITEWLREKMKLGKETPERNYFSKGKDKLPYRLIYPSQQDLTTKYPLLVYLHGSGSRGDDNEKPLAYLSPFLADTAPLSKHPCFVLIPQCPQNDVWVSFPDFPNRLSATTEPTSSTKLFLELVRHLVDTKNVDPARIYLTGYSMGGEGTFDVLAREPGLFACAAPLASVADTANVSKIKDVPLWVFHGVDDKVNDIKYSRMMVQALRQGGGNPLFSEFSGIGHDCRRQAYSDPEFWNWMFMQKKK